MFPIWLVLHPPPTSSLREFALSLRNVHFSGRGPGAALGSKRRSRGFVGKHPELAAVPLLE